MVGEEYGQLDAWGCSAKTAIKPTPPSTPGRGGGFLMLLITKLTNPIIPSRAARCENRLSLQVHGLSTVLDGADGATFSFDSKPSNDVACNIHRFKADLSHMMHTPERFARLNWLMQPDLKTWFWYRADVSHDPSPAHVAHGRRLCAGRQDERVPGPGPDHAPAGRVHQPEEALEIQHVGVEVLTADPWVYA